MRTLRITGWNVGAQSISAMKEIQSATGLRLADAKRLVEDVLGGEVVVLSLANESDAETHAATLRRLGLIVEVN